MALQQNNWVVSDKICHNFDTITMAQHNSYKYMYIYFVPIYNMYPGRVTTRIQKWLDPPNSLSIIIPLYTLVKKNNNFFLQLTDRYSCKKSYLFLSYEQAWTYTILFCVHFIFIFLMYKKRLFIIIVNNIFFHLNWDS